MKRSWILVLAGVIAIGCSPKPVTAPAGWALAPVTEADNIAEWVEKGVSVHSTVYMVKSQSHANMYWLAARLYGPGLANTWALFAHGGSFVFKKGENASFVYAAEAFSRQFSDAVDGCGNNKSGACMLGNPEAEQLYEYVQSIEPSDEKFNKSGHLVAGRGRGRTTSP